MTAALCLDCGSIKFGALIHCPSCLFEPLTEPSLSLMFSEHYFTMDGLSAVKHQLKSLMKIETNRSLRLLIFLSHLGYTSPDVFSFLFGSSSFNADTPELITIYDEVPLYRFVLNNDEKIDLGEDLLDTAYDGKRDFTMTGKLFKWSFLFSLIPLLGFLYYPFAPLEISEQLVAFSSSGVVIFVLFWASVVNIGVGGGLYYLWFTAFSRFRWYSHIIMLMNLLWTGLFVYLIFAIGLHSYSMIIASKYVDAVRHLFMIFIVLNIGLAPAFVSFFFVSDVLEFSNPKWNDI